MRYLFMICLLGCAGHRYIPKENTKKMDYVGPPTVKPTPHMVKTYQIYKDNPKKLKRWKEELGERGK